MKHLISVLMVFFCSYEVLANSLLEKHEELKNEQNSLRLSYTKAQALRLKSQTDHLMHQEEIVTLELKAQNLKNALPRELKKQNNKKLLNRFFKNLGL